MAMLYGTMKYFMCFGIMSLVLRTCISHENAGGPLQSLKHVQIVDSLTLEALRMTKTLSVIYFYAEDSSKKSFLTAFDESAKYLEAYSISLAVVNCVGNIDIDDECKDGNVGNNVVTYQNGMELIKMEHDTVFDIDSIMSNSLQLLLLYEVPIVDSESDREALQSTLLGQQDFIYFYTRDVGHFQHRVFMEIAYTYQDQYKFAITTKLDPIRSLQHGQILSLDVKYSLWIVFCSKATAEDNVNSFCPNVIYRGNLNLPSLAEFMKWLPEPNLFYAPENGTLSLFEMKSELPIIFIYSNKELKEHSDDVASSLSYDVKGFAMIIVVDVDDTACLTAAMKQGFDGHVPRVAIATPDGNLTLMEKHEKLESLEIQYFLTSATIPTNEREEVVNSTLASEMNQLSEAVEKQDDEVAIAVFKENGRHKPDVTHVPAVLKDSFHEIVQSAHLKMVLYYLPYDAVSLAFLNNFETAAKMLESTQKKQDVLARVNCYDATDLCGKENITVYPVVRIHKRNVPYQSYEGPLSTEAVLKAVGLLKLEFPLKLKNEDDLNKFLSGDFPTKTTHLSPASVLFVAKKKDKEAWTVFRAASKHLTTSVAMAEVQDNLENMIATTYDCPTPCVVSIHHKDTIKPVRVLSNVLDVEGVFTFVKQSMIATMPELTVANFPTLRAKNLPFVILFMNQSNPSFRDVKSTVTNLSSKDSFQDSIFCWMDVKEENTGLMLLKEYTDTIILPTIAMVDHKQGKVFILQPETVTSNQVMEWLTSVFNGNEKPAKIFKESKWSTPGPCYDFLTMIDNDREVEEPEQSLTAGYIVELEKEVREKLLKIRQDNIAAAKVEAENENKEKQGKGVSSHDPSEF